jgi:RHS repeat-associated protein
VPCNGFEQPSELILTAQDINELRVDDPPMIHPGDALVFEANRGDFVLELYLSNGKEIVTQPLTPADAEGMLVAWRKGRTKLDYSESVSQRIVGMKITALHQTGRPLLLRGVKIDREGRYVLELEKSHPGPTKNNPEPPMSYPPDPRVLTASVTVPSLFGRTAEGEYLAPHIPTFAMHSMMFQSTGTTSGDPNHFKYAGQELDAESGLYHMGARYYSPSLGRFTSPDPLYIELRRLVDPQALNLYAYARNNPTTFSDPSGLDVKLNCDTAANCNQAVKDFNSRKNAQFKVELGKDGKLHAIKDSVGKDLSKAESTLLGAINNTSNHATLNVVGSSGSADFATHDSRGANTVDLGNVGKLDSPSNAGGLGSGDVIAHEALEAYHSLSDEDGAHAFASQFFPGLSQPTNVNNATNPSGTRFTGETFDQRISDGRGSERVTIQFNTPIPAVDIFTRGRQAVEDAGSHVEGVTFVPKPQ